MILGVGLDRWILLLIAVLTLINTYYSRETKKAAVLTEKNTNSMKDALVAATAIASDATGFERGRQMEKVEQKERDT